MGSHGLPGIEQGKRHCRASNRFLKELAAKRLSTQRLWPKDCTDTWRTLTEGTESVGGHDPQLFWFKFGCTYSILFKVIPSYHDFNAFSQTVEFWATRTAPMLVAVRKAKLAWRAAPETVRGIHTNPENHEGIFIESVFCPVDKHLRKSLQIGGLTRPDHPIYFSMLVDWSARADLPTWVNQSGGDSTATYSFSESGGNESSYSKKRAIPRTNRRKILWGFGNLHRRDSLRLVAAKLLRFSNAHAASHDCPGRSRLARMGKAFFCRNTFQLTFPTLSKDRANGKGCMSGHILWNLKGQGQPKRVQDVQGTLNISKL